MNLRLIPSEFPRHKVRSFGGFLCTLLLVHLQCAANTGTATTSPSPAQAQQPAAASQPAAAQETPKIPVEQLDSLVAPIALYQDPLLSQVLVASTYPLEIVQLQQWLVKNPTLKDQALVDAVKKQPWDASIQAMAALPDVVKRLNDDIQWTTDLGNAFLAQQTDLMDAVQRMRKKAQDKGALKSNEQLKVETKVVESKQVIVVEQSNPQVVYVPSYDPVVVYGPPVDPYPPIAYPPYVPGAALLGFGVGLAMGAAWGGGWGWGAGWGGGDVNVNVNNNFNRNTNIQGGNRTNVSGGNRVNAGGGSGKWQHNPSHRGGAPYGDKGTANKFGGSARGDSLSNRQAGARNQIGNQGGNLPSNSGAGNRAGVSDRSSGGAGDRGGDRGGSDRGGASDRSSGGAGDRGSSNRGSSGGGDRVGSRDVSSRSGGSDRSGFGGGGGGGFSGSSARSSSSRGSGSFGGGGGGGGMSRGGGGGMSRGGGGGGRRYDPRISKEQV